MQKWYDDGYFVPTLLMRRVNVDKEWTSVGDLLQLTGGTRVFTTPLPAPLTSGFLRRDVVLDGPPNIRGTALASSGNFWLLFVIASLREYLFSIWSKLADSSVRSVSGTGLMCKESHPQISSLD